MDTRQPADPRYQIRVTVETEFLPAQSDQSAHRWVFAYQITLLNEGTLPAKLLTRHWVITDGNERVQEVHGEGVVGEQPTLLPGQQYHYSSGVVLDTEIGTMHGSYQMISEDGTCFDANIPAFTLATPNTLH